MEGNKKIVEAAKKLILNCMGTKPEEKLLIVADEKTFELGYAFAEAGRACGIETSFVEAPAPRAIIDCFSSIIKMLYNAASPGFA